MSEIKSEPCLTEEAIDFIASLVNDLSYVLEFGVGSSTLWLSTRCGHLVSIEHNKKWLDFISKEMCNRSLSSTWVSVYRENKYERVLKGFDKDHFDLILVDGIRRNQCIIEAVEHLKPGGFLMLNNAELKDYREGVLSVSELLGEPTVSQQSTPHRTWASYQVPRKYFSWQTVWWQKK